jgi:hypothetical protein
MTKVMVELSMSLDGYVTGPDVSPEEPMGRGGERRQDRRTEPHPLTRGLVNPLVFDPGLPDRHRTCGRGDLPPGVIAVAHHHPPAVLVELVGVSVDVGGDLGLQRRGEHLTGAVTDDLVEQRRTARRPAGRVGLRLLVDYLELGRTFPDRRANAGPDQTCYGLQIFLGKVRPFTSPAEGHPQVLIIAPSGFRAIVN